MSNEDSPYKLYSSVQTSEWSPPRDNFRYKEDETNDLNRRELSTVISDLSEQRSQLMQKINSYKDTSVYYNLSVGFLFLGVLMFLITFFDSGRPLESTYRFNVVCSNSEFEYSLFDIVSVNMARLLLFLNMVMFIFALVCRLGSWSEKRSYYFRWLQQKYIVVWVFGILLTGFCIASILNGIALSSRQTRVTSGTLTKMAIQANVYQSYFQSSLCLLLFAQVLYIRKCAINSDLESISVNYVSG
eukprot:TRINITY_DN12372_c0_g1_i1.p1 TRINITY_DN12372_c0_g1~~TRINITY_DN12372_c0_g1_i1.p1  ORF type:complete len:244 (+),score=8.07 TRINITY_DN12372_c0_g1_i1:40-771(+)